MSTSSSKVEGWTRNFCPSDSSTDTFHKNDHVDFFGERIQLHSSDKTSQLLDIVRVPLFLSSGGLEPLTHSIRLIRRREHTRYLSLKRITRRNAASTDASHVRAHYQILPPSYDITRPTIFRPVQSIAELIAILTSRIQRRRFTTSKVFALRMNGQVLVSSSAQGYSV